MHYRQEHATTLDDRHHELPVEVNNITITLKKLISKQYIMKIQANHSGTRSIELSEKHFKTIEKYSLLDNLVDSNGIIDEPVLDKLKFNVRSMLESETMKDNNLLDLCLDVIYNNNMKAFGLQQLVEAYKQWKAAQPAADDNDPQNVTD